VLLPARNRIDTKCFRSQKEVLEKKLRYGRILRFPPKSGEINRVVSTQLNALWHMQRTSYAGRQVHLDS